MGEPLTEAEIAAIEARYRPQESQGQYGLRTLLLGVVDSHKIVQAQLVAVELKYFTVLAKLAAIALERLKAGGGS